MNRYSNWDGWMVFLASCLVVAAVFPTILLHPNTTLFSVGGDGIKNYFTALYYLQHNSGIRFTGMNYPFGEHILFGDAQPGLMIPFGWLCSVFPALSQHHLAFFNYSVLTGMALGAPAVFLLLKEFRVVRWQALVAALCISFLSPQVLRAENHYGLSYFFLFPLTWLVCLRAAARPGIKWTGTGILLVVATGLLHFYLALLSCLFLLGYALLTTLLRRKKETIAAKLSWWGIPLSGLLLLQLFVRLTDGVSDRPQKPWGFLTTLADWRSILQPLPSDLLRRNIPEYRGFEEGFSYIGSLPIVFLACFLVTGLFLLFRRRRNGYEHLPFLHQQELLFFLSSAGLLLFAMGIPFIWNMEWLADRLSVLRQFRGLGRFAWAFYSVCTVLAVVGFSRFTGFISGKKYAWAGKGAIALLYLLWAGEAGWRMYTFHKFDNTASLYYRIFTENSYRQQLEREGYRTDHFQAVLCLPYSHIGSEKFALDNWPSPYFAMRAAYHTGLPAMNVMMSRTSLSQSCLLMQFTGDTVLQKEVISQLPSTKPLLLLTHGTQFTPAEQYLIRNAKKICSDAEATLYELPLAAFRAQTEALSETYRQRDQLLQNRGGCWNLLPDRDVLLQHYSNRLPFDGSQFVDKRRKKNVLVSDTVLHRFRFGDTVELRLWVRIDPEKDAVPILYLEEYADGVRVGLHDMPSKSSREVYRDMICISGNYVLKSNAPRIRVSLHIGSSYGNLMVYKSGDQVFVPAEGNRFFFNNLPAGF